MMSPKKKVVYIISNIQKSVSFEWIAASALARDFDLSFILLNSGKSFLEDSLKQIGIPVFFVRYRGKKDLPRAVFQIARHLKTLKPDLVHTHLLDASLAGLCAATLTGVPQRIHTRHHSNMHQLRYRHALVYDRLINFLSTRIVATCRNVREVLVAIDSAPQEKVSVIHFGFELGVFNNIQPERVSKLRQKYALKGRGPVVGVISRYMEYKGIQYVIPAFERLLKTYPDACLFLANTSGKEYADVIKELLKRLPPGSYREVPFEEDFAALYRLFDVFVNAPVDQVREAFGQIYVESLAAGIPSVFTLSGVASEFVEHEKNALVVGYRDSDQIHDAIVRLLEDPALAERLRLKGKLDVASLFPLQNMIAKLAQLYSL